MLSHNNDRYACSARLKNNIIIINIIHSVGPGGWTCHPS